MIQFINQQQGEIMDIQSIIKASTDAADDLLAVIASSHHQELGMDPFSLAGQVGILRGHLAQLDMISQLAAERRPRVRPEESDPTPPPLPDAEPQPRKNGNAFAVPDAKAFTIKCPRCKANKGESCFALQRGPNTKGRVEPERHAANVHDERKIAWRKREGKY